MIRVTTLRHSIAAKAVDNTVAADLVRPLTSEGMKLARMRRQKLGNPHFDLVIASPLLRTVQTAKIVANVLERDVLKLRSLGFFDETEADKAMNAMFEELGYAALSAYRDHKDGHYVDEKGETACNDLAETILTQVGFGNDEFIPNVLVVGHAININSMGRSWSVRLGYPGRFEHVRTLESISFRETEGYIAFVIDGGTMELFPVIDPPC